MNANATVEAARAKIEDLKARAQRAAFQGRHDDCKALIARACKLDMLIEKVEGVDNNPADLPEQVQEHIRGYRGYEDATVEEVQDADCAHVAPAHLRDSVRVLRVTGHARYLLGRFGDTRRKWRTIGGVVVTWFDPCWAD